MKSRPVAAAIAVSVGLIILLGTFIPLPLFEAVRIELIHWAVILAGVAVLVGIGNLFSVHYQRIRRRASGSVYSLLLLVSMLATLFVLLLGQANGQYEAMRKILVDAVIFPVEASLMALLAVTLLYAAVRLLRRRSDLMSIVFLGTAVLSLLASASLPFIGEIPILGDLIQPLLTTAVAGGARGILLGVALGALTTGLRVLFALDRPYGGK